MIFDVDLVVSGINGIGLDFGDVNRAVFLIFQIKSPFRFNVPRSMRSQTSPWVVCEYYGDMIT